MLTIFTIIFFGLLSNQGRGQATCRVLVPEIAESYTGDCKNGLAHGEGEAKGKDSYIGKFRKGYPDGFGTYTWSTGEVYTGTWKKGRRNGKGKYIFSTNDEDSIQEGNWKNDEFIGSKEGNGIKVRIKRNVIRYTTIRKSEGNQVMVKILVNGVPNFDIEDLLFIGDSGSEIRYNEYIGYEFVEFPFWGKVTYRTWNKLKTIQYDAVFEFEISRPGYWEITLHN
ncbi:MAG: hypothetical protein JSV24_06810 [Bacteroidales bacterium]|nr:MAG: hypothetical protein JSV24_06810 [Bacteroidales bacterium]